jgi:hypothetical protein
MCTALTTSKANRLTSFVNHLFKCKSISGCVPLAFSGCASASVAPQAVTLDCAVKVQIVQTLCCVRVQAVCFPLPLCSIV